MTRHAGRRYFRRSVSVMVISLLGSACTNTYLIESEQAKTDLIGLEKSDLMACAGVPERTGFSEPNKEFFSYSSERTVHRPTYPTYGYYPTFGYYGNRRRHYSPVVFYGGPVTQEEMRKCTATFALQEDRVISLSYSLNDEDSYGRSQCYQIVKNCLPERPE